jgi:Fe-S cluster biogenesis protein NfuA
MTGKAPPLGGVLHLQAPDAVYKHDIYDYIQRFH